MGHKHSFKCLKHTYSNNTCSPITNPPLHRPYSSLLSAQIPPTRGSPMLDLINRHVYHLQGLKFIFKTSLTPTLPFHGIEHGAERLPLKNLSSSSRNPIITVFQPIHFFPSHVPSILRCFH